MNDLKLEYPQNLLRRYKLSLISDNKLDVILSFLKKLNVDDGDDCVYINRSNCKIFGDVLNSLEISFVNIIAEWCEFLYHKTIIVESYHW